MRRTDDAALGRRIVGLAGVADLADNRRHVDDAALARLHHDLPRGRAEGQAAAVSTRLLVACTGERTLAAACDA